MKKTGWYVLPLLVWSACDGSSPADVDARGDGPQAAADAGGMDGAVAGGDVGAGDLAPDTGVDAATDAGAAGWAAVEAALVAGGAAAGVTDFGLVVWDAGDRKIYEHMLGGFTADTRVAVASASKLVSALVLFDVIGRGKLTLDATTAQVLGWTGANGAITLRHLLSFTSGLPREASCTLNAAMSLAACVDSIATTPVVAAPGARFDYGSTHLHVAARMAEVVSGRSWAQLFDESLRVPLSLPEDVAYFTLPRQAVGRMNPLIAGGLRASMNDYGRFLGLAFHKGTLGGVTVGTPALYDAQAREPFPAVTVGYTPFPEARYGLGAWVMCEAPGAGCPLVTSPGAFGFTPWLDRDAGYYAILGMQLADTGGGDRPAEFAMKLLTQLRPLIRAQLGR
jgi:D-alanyl-D-alanine-carboxypeptidase/D-alanyl-D-alanine-endopeptidase